MQLRQAPVAQLDRVFDYESKGRGFESLLACHPVDIKKIFAQKTALWRGFLMPRRLDF